MKLVKNNQNGRSMVEMLGVLAIIGVLSVGAIAGYSKAMTKYKTNKIIGEITNIVQNYRIACHDKSCNDSSTTNPELFKKLNIFPDYMWQSDNTLKNSFGGKTAIFDNSNVMRIYNESIPYDICIGLATTNWENIDPFYIQILNPNTGDDFLFFSHNYESQIKSFFGDGMLNDIRNENEFYTWLPVSVEKAHNACVSDNVFNIHIWKK